MRELFGRKERKKGENNTKRKKVNDRLEARKIGLKQITKRGMKEKL